MTIKVPAWSYSAISLFKTCPRKYQAERVTKEVPYVESESMRYGTELHKASEEFIGEGKPLDPRFSFMLPILEGLSKKEGTFHCEMKMGLKKSDDKYEACDFFDKDVWFRGVADLVIINGDKAYIVDYKTGKSSRYADTLQLDLMAACVFTKYPEVTKIYASLLFVVVSTQPDVSKDDWFISSSYNREDALKVFSELYPVLERRTKAYETGVFNPTRNGLCRSWCSVHSCPHFGGR